MLIRLIVPLLVLLCAIRAYGGEIFYESGPLRMFSAEGRADQSAREADAVQAFLGAYFSNLPQGFAYWETRRLEDHTHVHVDLELRFKNAPVLESRLRLHYNKQGFIDYATNPLKHPVRKPMETSRTRLSKGSIETRYKNQYTKGSGASKVTATPSYFFLENGDLVPVYEVHVYSREPLFTRHFYVHAESGEVIVEKRAYRFADANHKVYVVHPDRAGLVDRTFTGTDGLSVMSDGSAFHVRRMPLDTSYPSVDVTLGTDFTVAVGFDSSFHNGGNYNAACTSTDTRQCPNQAFDALNVFFHVREYRANLDSYLTALGLTSNVIFSLDPLEVVVNMLAFDLNGVNAGLDEANNAFYASGALDVQGNVRSGLFFLRPADTAANSSICPSTAFLNLARESSVVVHEYQHYITDIITKMVAGSQVSNVGDALHEGYSDYFGASQINRLNAEASPLVTEIGEFAFKNCSAFRRDIGELKVFSNTSSENPQNDFDDPHIAGWTWASGLWQLREELGRDVTDRLALKSMFFLSTNPGFLESIEALVQSDQALNAGANVSRIRALFYTELKFTGALNTQLFRDPDNLIFEMGFNSCLSVPASARSIPTFLGGLLWLLLTLGWGRRAWRD